MAKTQRTIDLNPDRDDFIEKIRGPLSKEAFLAGYAEGRLEEAEREFYIAWFGQITDIDTMKAIYDANQ